MGKKSYNRILAKMLAKFAVDAEPEELEEAVDAIEEITSEEPAPAPAPVEEEPATDDGEEVIKMILSRLDALEQKINAGATDEEPEEMDPLARLEQDLDEIEAQQAPAAVEEQEEEVITPDVDPDEMESYFVPPEEINETDEDEEFVAASEEEVPMEDCGPKKASDAARIALNAIKPVIASLPPAQRKKAADKAVTQIRKASGLDARAKKNGYIALKRRKASDSNVMCEAEIGKAIMAKRNPNYKK